jgi:hypothetical protein
MCVRIKVVVLAGAIIMIPIFAAIGSSRILFLVLIAAAGRLDVVL